MTTKPTIETSNELIPPEGDKDVGYKVFTVLSEIVEHKEQAGLNDKWNRAAELTRNKHWKQKSGKPGLVTANLLFSHRQRTVNMLTDNNPTFNVSPIGSSANEDFAEKLLRLSEYWWLEQEQQSIFEMSVGSSEEMGSCVEKVFFNPDCEINGEVETINIPLFNIGFYPTSTLNPKKAEAILHYYSMSLREARRRWPEVADKISSDDDILKQIGDNRQEIAGGDKEKNGSYLSTFLSTVKNIMSSSSGSAEGSDEVLIVECWVKDYTQIPIGDPQDDSDGQIKQMYGPKYKGNIRCIQACNGGQLVLSDRDNPSINPNISDEEAINCYLYDKFPFPMAQSITDSVSIFGMSDYEQLEQLNIEVDKTISQLTLMKDKASRLKIINPKDSGVPNSHFTNKPGTINPSNAMVGAGIRYMENPKIPGELVQALEIYKDLFYTVSGSFDMEQAGGQGKNVIAYKAIAALIERSSTMLKGKIRNYSKLIRERGRMYISCAQNWYTEQRWISFEKDGESQEMAITGKDILFPARISVVSGSTMPRARVQEREEAIELFRMGAIDQEELFKRLDWPDRKNLLDRIKLGPVGAVIQRMSDMGLPPQVVQIIDQVATLDDKQFEKAMTSGQVPNIMQLLTQMQGQPKPDYESAQKDADINKIKSEILLNAARAKTEQIKQVVAMAGVQFDQESLRQNWAKIEAMVDDKDMQHLIGSIDAGVKVAQASGQYDEKGIKSNNMRGFDNADI